MDRQTRLHRGRPIAQASDDRAGDRRDVYARITDEIVATIEAGPGRWRLPWHHDGGDLARPLNLASRKRYRGINVLALWIAAMKSGYASGVWGTYRQFAAAGGQVRKGERAITVVFWKQFQRGEAEDGSGQERGSDRDRGDARDDAHGRARFMARGYHVFNLAQVDGLALPPQTALPEGQRMAAAERFFAHLGIEIRTEGDQACYVPSLDIVRMPPFARFRSAEAFYATTAHECAHATSHPSRLDRKLDTRFGSRAYAAEEAIAELASSYLMADFGFAYGARPESAAYLASWIQVLKSDSRAIFTAAAKAQAAADWMHAQQPDADGSGTPDDDHADTVDPMATAMPAASVAAA
jgi:antirestriction protein ArdC